MFNVPNHSVKLEQLYESLLSKSSETDEYFKVSPDLRDLNYNL